MEIILGSLPKQKLPSHVTSTLTDMYTPCRNLEELGLCGPYLCWLFGLKCYYVYDVQILQCMYTPQLCKHVLLVGALCCLWCVATCRPGCCGWYALCWVKSAGCATGCSTLPVSCLIWFDKQNWKMFLSKSTVIGKEGFLLAPSVLWVCMVWCSGLRTIALFSPFFDPFVILSWYPSLLVPV